MPRNTNELEENYKLTVSQTAIMNIEMCFKVNIVG